MGIEYYGIKNNSNYVITTDGKLFEVGRNRRFNIAFPTVIDEKNLWKTVQCKQYSTNMAIQSDGTLWSWGYNGYGQLGLSDQSNRSSPTQVGNLSTWTKVDCSQHTLAIQSNGTLWSWGFGDYGQLGLSVGGITRRSTPVQVGSLSVWSQVFVGYAYSVAIQSNGTLWTWGRNPYGQLGNNTFTTQLYSPAQLGNLSNWSKISCGYANTLAILSDGTLWSWGYNNNGQLGLSDQTNRSSPVQVGALNVWTQVSCGYSHVLALQSNGTLWSWGANSLGQLGSSNVTRRSSPVQVGTLSNWSNIFGGDQNSAAIQSNGTLWYWGSNSWGQSGLSDNTHRLTPIQIINNGLRYNNSTVALGERHLVVIQSNGSLWTCGNNTNGQLGYDSTSYRSSAIQVGNLSIWSKLPKGTADVAWSLVIDNSNTLYGFGDNTDWQMNYKEASLYYTNSVKYPVGDGQQITFPVPITSNVATVSAGANSAVFVKTNGTLWAWGLNTWGQIGTSLVQNLSPIEDEAIFLTSEFSVIQNNFNPTSAGIQSDGTLWVWGSNSYGQLGLNTLTNQHRSNPIQINRNFWIKSSIGLFHHLAIQSNGTLWAWGLNSYGQLGLNTLTNYSSPVQVGTENLWTSIHAGALSSYGIQSDGTLWSWGYNFYGGLGSSNLTNRSSPVQVGALTVWKTLPNHGAGLHMLAIQSDNTLWSWGANSYGQNGRGVSGAGIQSPTQVGSLSLWTKISTGYYNSYGIQSDGLLWAWGSNSFGQTGTNSTVDAKNPSNVSGTWKEISAGQWHAAGIQSNGTLWAWGMNSVRLIVSADITQRLTPVQIGSNSDWVQVSCGDGTIFAQRSNGSRYSWGLNNLGQLGRLPNFSYSPIQIGSLSNWTNAICGTNFVIAQKSDNTLWAWGNNSYGQYGNNSRSAGLSSPVQAGNSTSDWKNIAVGDYFTAGIKNDNTLWTWGNNTCGQLGLSDTTDRISVVQVGSNRNYKNIYAMPNALLINLY